MQGEKNTLWQAENAKSRCLKPGILELGTLSSNMKIRLLIKRATPVDVDRDFC